MRKSILRVLGFLLVPSLLLAQYGKITGVVKDAETNDPLPGVTVVVVGTVLGAPSDANGKFTLLNVPAGEQKIQAASVGYSSETKTVTVTAGGEATVEFALKTNPIQTSPVVVTSLRAVEKETPVAFSNVTAMTIKRDYTVQDVPMLLKNLPGVYGWADGGVGLGDASVSIRGFSQDRIQTMINGIPENDPESRRIYWNDFPDLLANVSSIQVQRGVGNSLYGSSALAGSINIETADYAAAPSFAVSTGYGSFNLSKISVAANTGLVDGRYAAYARVSHLKGDGYRDYSWADYWGYFIGGAVYFDKVTMKLNFYQSPEVNHYSYIYPSQAQIDKYGRTYNPMGTNDPQGQRYNYNQFNQPHYELHLNYAITPETNWSTSIFYLRGQGFGSHWTGFGSANSYFPNYAVKNAAGKYVIVTSTSDSLTSVATAFRYVTDNYQYGLLSNVTYKLGKNDLAAGIELRQWHARHYGILDYTSATPVNFAPGTDLAHFYDYNGNKFVFAGFIHTMWRLEKLNLMADLQFSAPTYYLTEKFVGSNATNVPTGTTPRTTPLDNYKTPFSFLTPRLGITYNLSESISAFVNFSQAKEEPAQGAVYNSGLLRTDLNPEFMKADIEIGAEYTTNKYHVKLDYFNMNFSNELITVYDPTSPSADANGNTLANGQHTTHQGVEFDGAASLTSSLQVNANFTYSNNQFTNQVVQTGKTSSVTYSGKYLPNFPVTMINVGATYTYENAFANVSVNNVGKQYIDNLNSYGTVSSYTLLNAVLGYSFKNVLSTKSIDFTLNWNNIANTKYYAYGTVFGTTPEYLVGAPANYFATLNFNW
ncbi:MAG: TonB-dependent receptor [Bacteroidota bacterium]|nr:TonB-dependent receptor [Bacteroidota bacterium]